MKLSFFKNKMNPEILERIRSEMDFASRYQDLDGGRSNSFKQFSGKVRPTLSKSLSKNTSSLPRIQEVQEVKGHKVSIKELLRQKKELR